MITTSTRSRKKLPAFLDMAIATTTHHTLEENPDPKKIIKTENVFLASDVVATTGVEPGTEVDHNLTVFTFEASPSVLKAIADHSINQELQKFISCYKRLRSLMYSARGSVR